SAPRGAPRATACQEGNSGPGWGTFVPDEAVTFGDGPCEKNRRRRTEQQQFRDRHRGHRDPELDREDEWTPVPFPCAARSWAAAGTPPAPTSCCWPCPTPRSPPPPPRSPRAASSAT